VDRSAAIPSTRSSWNSCPDERRYRPGMTGGPDAVNESRHTAIYLLHDVVKNREAKGVAFRLRVPSLRIDQGEQIALIGESGSGKSTLLDMLAFILQPSAAGAFRFRPEVEKEPVDVDACWQNDKLNTLGDLRKQHIGYVMQTGGLLPYLTVRDNINLCRNVLGMKRDGTVEHLAEVLGIVNQLKKLPDELSTGERQRVAIGRALAHRPAIVIADEPTASLDPYAAEKVMALFLSVAEEFNSTVILASHAWRHVKELGLRRLSHRTTHTKDSKLTETVVSG
jgi:putative ABC transport system ATP-binding protein